jgi:hypothetical protein
MNWSYRKWQASIENRCEKTNEGILKKAEENLEFDGIIHVDQLIKYFSNSTIKGKKNA